MFVLGGGSNIVVADTGFPGLVLRVCIRGIETKLDGDHVESPRAPAKNGTRSLLARSQTTGPGWNASRVYPGASERRQFRTLVLTVRTQARHLFGLKRLI